MAWRLTSGELGAFRSCRRRWELSSRHRMNLEPVEPSPRQGLLAALKEALAVYYFPGMWDWPREVVLPLSRKGFERSIESARQARGPSSSAAEWLEVLELGREVLKRYTSWALRADRFAPVMVEAEVAVALPDPCNPGRSLATEGGELVRYEERVDALVIDGFDSYWILRHRFVEDWTPRELLALDEQSLAACWAWEEDHLGMLVAGTIDNEVLLVPATGPSVRPLEGGGDDQEASRAAASSAAGPPWGLEAVAPRQSPGSPLVRQHDPSGGGRAVPQHQRASVRLKEPKAAPRVEVEEGPGIRRTWIRRSREELELSSARLARLAAEAIAPSVLTYPSPSPALCSRCPYVGACMALSEGSDPAQAPGYRVRGPEDCRPAPRLGSTSWGFGRGAAPPGFGDPRS